jgi:hypothetical protein
MGEVMAHLFIRVELRGSPSGQDYDNLHAYMEQNNWYRKIQGTAGVSNLPHAVYQGNSENDPSTVTTALKKGIETNVWTNAIVLIISATKWAMNPA